MIDLGGINIGQEVALTDAGTDVAVPLFKVAVGASVDRRLNVSLQVPRKDQAFVARVLLTTLVVKLAAMAALATMLVRYRRVRHFIPRQLRRAFGRRE